MDLIKKLEELQKSNIYPFHMPGHKRVLAKNSLMNKIYGIDITEIDGFDNLGQAEGILKDAQEEAARLFKADKTFFLLNGATVGILSAICGLVNEEDIVIMARNCHKSVYNGVMLSGAKSYYIYPESESYFEICGGISPLQVEEAINSLPADKKKILVITSPTYEGVISDIEGIAQVCHNNNVLLVVDSAHGAHLGFSSDFPKSAIECGSDVVITSIHKTLPAPTQTALMHINKSCSEVARIEKMLRVFMTSSPSYVLMSGICDCLDLLEKEKDALFDNYSKNLNQFYEKASEFANLSLLTEEKLTAKGSFLFDKGKILVSDTRGKYTGKELYNILRQEYDIQPEMALNGYVLLMSSIADDDKAFDRLYEALLGIDKHISDESIPLKKRNLFGKIIDKFMAGKIKKVLFSPGKNLDIQDNLSISFGPKLKAKKDFRETFWQDTSWVPVELSEGKISANYVVPYPPCVPLIVPGEEISGEAVDRILEYQSQNIQVNGINSDKEIEVVWEKSST